tara:strand:+ start:454 stop:588 length:135 start_codon:yes stop_codon:yes gene_type:complete
MANTIYTGFGAKCSAWEFLKEQQPKAKNDIDLSAVLGSGTLLVS